LTGGIRRAQWADPPVVYLAPATIRYLLLPADGFVGTA